MAIFFVISIVFFPGDVFLYAIPIVFYDTWGELKTEGWYTKEVVTQNEESNEEDNQS